MTDKAETTDYDDFKKHVWNVADNTGMIHRSTVRQGKPWYDGECKKKDDN